MDHVFLLCKSLGQFKLVVIEQVLIRDHDQWDLCPECIEDGTRA